MHNALLTPIAMQTLNTLKYIGVHCETTLTLPKCVWIVVIRMVVSQL